MSSRDLGPGEHSARSRDQEEARSSAGLCWARAPGDLQRQMAEHPLSLLRSQPIGWNRGTAYLAPP